MGGEVKVSNHSHTNSTATHGYANSTLPIGMMLLGLAAVSIGFHVAKQSNIVACIIIGAVVGAMHWDKAMDLSRETAHAFSEIGIILVLFTAGMEVDVPGFLKMWKPAVINGFGQIGITLAIFAGLGAGTGITTNPVQTVYFGLAFTLSSTILVISALTTRGELQSMHGQIILGLMALQDVSAVLAFSVMSGFDSKIKNPAPVGMVIGIVFGKLFAMLFCLFLLNKFVLNHIFRIFAKTSEMLFIGTFSYCLGVAGICSLFGLAEMGAFWAGVSIAALPYRHEIETHAEPIKMFGVVMFFFMLGIDLNLTIEGLRKAAPMAALITALTVFVLPMIMWFLGALSRMDGRSAFLVGHLIGQVSEFSLIMATLAKGYGIFDDTIFMIVILSTLFTFVLSSTGHSLTERIYRSISCVLAPLDRNAIIRAEEDDDFPLHNHVVLLGFNEIALEVAEHYRRRGVEVLCLQTNPAIHDIFHREYAAARAAAAATAAAAASKAAAEDAAAAAATTTTTTTTPSPSAATGGDAGGGRSAAADVDVAVTGVAFGSRAADAGAGDVYCGGGGAPDPEVEDGRGAADSGAGGAGRYPTVGSNVHGEFSSPMNPKTWHHFELHHAQLVVCCEPAALDRCCELCKELRPHGTVVVAVTDSNANARRLYRAGARFVVQAEYLAARAARAMVEAAGPPVAGEPYLRDEREALERRIREEVEDPVLRALAPFM